jgi:hypothetical protein
LHEHAEVFLQQHDIRCLLGDIDGTLDGDAHIGGVKGGSIVDAVAHVSYDAARLFEREDDAFLLVRLDLGKDVHANHAVQQGAVAQRLQVRPDEDLRARQARLPADAGRYQAIVPRDDL